jgi:hypothetical protein
MKHDLCIGDDVIYLAGYCGYFSAVVVGHAWVLVIIEFMSGQRIVCRRDELERA